jgi:hypothetical protein
VSAAGPWAGGDPEIDAFVAANLISFAAWDLVIYFNRNPEALVSARSLSSSLGRPEPDMEPAVRRLIENRVIIAALDDGELSYGLSPDEGVRRAVASFVSAASRRDRRLEFVRRVLAHVTGGTGA